MRNALLLAAVAVPAVLLSAPAARAQASAPPAAGSTSAPPEDAPPSTVPSGACHLGATGAIAPADAETATRLLCSEVIQAGAPPDARYRVSFGTLGALVIVSVEREGDTPGSVVDSRTMTLHGIEEITVAAPRLADALVHGRPVAETQTVDNVVSEEARTPLTRTAKLKLGLGLAGTLTPYDGIGVAPAIVLDMHYDVGQMEIGGSLRMSSPSTWASQASSETTLPAGGFASASLGARYFTTAKDVSPYVGGGLAYSYYRIATEDGFDGNASGLDAYVDAGIEILRTHRSRLAIGARFDLPFFALNDQPNFWPQPNAPKPPSTLYFAPVSAEARFTF